MPTFRYPKHVSIFEVGPRDGLQSEAHVFSLEKKRDLVLGLAAAGLKDIEAGSFVRSDRIPQLTGSDELIGRLKKNHAQELMGTRLWAFVPNQVGLEKALASDVDGVSLFVAASETFCQKNVNRTRQQLLAEMGPLLKQARAAKKLSRVYLSTLVYCPYEGVIAAKEIEKVVASLWDFGAKEIVLSDTTGHANPESLAKILEKLLKKYPAKNLALHLHDTRGLALANVLRGLEFGLARFDSSVAGLGGCPYAPGASGNLATEDLANMLLAMGLVQGVDLGRIAKVGLMAEAELGRPLPSKVLRTLSGSGAGSKMPKKENSL